MSGIEIAGLVLGALPLIIQAIDSYKEGLDPIRAFVRRERDLPNLIRKLRAQHVHYALTMRILLEPITTEFELDEMLSDPAGARLWKDKHMAEKLRNRLQDSFQAYQSTITDIESIMKNIASRLDLGLPAELKKDDLEAILVATPKQSGDNFEFRKRVRFAMSKKTITKLLEELHDCNKELERFTDKSERIDNFRRTIKPYFAERLKRFQKYATDLHHTLSSVCWSCSCKEHSTNLELDQRVDLYTHGTKSASVAQKTSFKVYFSSGPNAQSWKWQAAEITVDEDEDYETLQVIERPKTTKSVSFGNIAPPPYSTADPTRTLRPTPQEVEDLCASIRELNQSSPCIGFSFDTKSKLRGTYPVNVVGEKRVAPSGSVTLEELLTQPPVIDGRLVKLKQKDMYSLALTLASSTLQLNATPWFPDHWTAKDILFPRTVSTVRPVDFSHPYVSPYQLTRHASIVGRCGTARGPQQKNTTLLALAVTLLELYFGTSAQKRPELENVDRSITASDSWVLCAMVNNWVEEEEGNLPAGFSKAISHCLQCFAVPGASPHSAPFLQAAIESIVLPLQEDMHHFLGTSGP